MDSYINYEDDYNKYHYSENELSQHEVNKNEETKYNVKSQIKELENKVENLTQQLIISMTNNERLMNDNDWLRGENARLRTENGALFHTISKNELEYDKSRTNLKGQIDTKDGQIIECQHYFEALQAILNKACKILQNGENNNVKCYDDNNNI